MALINRKKARIIAQCAAFSFALQKAKAVLQHLQFMSRNLSKAEEEIHQIDDGVSLTLLENKITKL